MIILSANNPKTPYPMKEKLMPSLLPFQTLRKPIRSIKVKIKHITLFTVTFLFFAYILYTLKYMFPYNATLCTRQHYVNNIPHNDGKTQLHHIVFGIATSENLWQYRKEYIKLWWRPNETRGYVWFDKLSTGNGSNDDDDRYTSLPPLRMSSDISGFKYTNKEGDLSTIWISRIVSETVRLGLDDVRWIVMGDDDTVFVVENLVRVLEKYDHREYYYIGGSFESHLQNIKFSYNMAYRGGGFAISYALAKALEKIQDECLQRHPGLYGSDDRIQACMNTN